jgi:hypothetical protein
VIGVVLIIIAMAVVGPIGLFLVGAIWSGVSGWVLSDDADSPHEGSPAEPQPSS